MKRVSPLSPELIASLDAVRAGAALYVAVGHVAISRGWDHGPGMLFRFGQEAVIVFFLLSGFVIFANEAYRPRGTAGYYMRRFLRIYPPFVMALLLTAVIALANGTFSELFSWWGLAGNLLNLQDEFFEKPGGIVGVYMGNDSLWSLSYDVAFYAAFPFVLAFWRRNPGSANHLIGSVSCLAYILYVLVPNHFALVAAYFLTWWAGAMAAEACLMGKASVYAIRVPVLWLAALTILAGAIVPVVGFRQVGMYPFLMFRHFGSALLFLIMAFAPLGKYPASYATRIRAPLAFFASISYGIYVFHYPLLVEWRFAWTAPGFCATAVLLLTLSYAVDRQLGRALREWQRRRENFETDLSIQKI